MHFKHTDREGEAGRFDAKVKQIEEFDRLVARVVDLKPDVLIVTGDHSTPAVAKAHTANPVPFLVHAAGVRPDGAKKFGERECARGTWGIIHGTQLLPIALSLAGKLKKFGA